MGTVVVIYVNIILSLVVDVRWRRTSSLTDYNGSYLTYIVSDGWYSFMIRVDYLGDEYSMVLNPHHRSHRI